MMNSVKFISSDWAGAPVLSGQLGSLVGVLDACLVNGFGESAVQANVVVSAGVGVVHSQSHRMRLIDDETGCVGIFSGGTLNGVEFRVTAISGENGFSFSTDLPDGSYTAVSVKVAPLGWEKIHGDTQRGAYRRKDPAATKMTLQVDDNRDNAWATIYMHENVQPTISYWNLPTTPATYCYKSNVANTSLRKWRLIGDGKTFYFFCDSTNNNTYSYGFSFGDICPGMISDKFNCMIIAGPTSADVVRPGYVNGDVTGAWISRAVSQMGSAIPHGRYSHRRFAVMGKAGIINPSPVDGLIHLWQVEIWDMGAIQQYRGIMRGLYCPIHYLLHESTFRGKDGKKYISLDGYDSARMVFDLEGPWA